VPDIIALDDLRVLTVSGPERTGFLQGQLTQDVKLARADSTLLSGWTDARGRLLFAGHLFTLGTASDAPLALLVPESLAEPLLKRMQMYVLRARVQIGISGLVACGLYAARRPVDDGGAQRLRIAGDDTRSLLIGPARDPATVDRSQQARNDWLLADIRAGIPTIATGTSGEFIPQMVNLDLLDGISFSKGCYTGQEIIARTKYLGRVKRRMLRFSAGELPPAPGASVHAARGAVGQVVSAAATPEGCEMLAVITIDDLPGPFFLESDQARILQRLDLPCEVPV
jgi:folate-binding protein YgfZ